MLVILMNSKPQKVILKAIPAPTHILSHTRTDTHMHTHTRTRTQVYLQAEDNF